jgi:hypothetical protein
MLQSNKRLFSDFDKWYEGWQVKLKSDPLMKWMVEARNKIEKQGDLESHSYVKAEILASYTDDGLSIEVPLDLFEDTKQLFSKIKDKKYQEHITKDGVLRIQRKWVENSLKEYELLEAVAIAYGRISELVDDAHRQLGLSIPATISEMSGETYGKEFRNGKLPCMVGHGDLRTMNFWIESGAEIEISVKDQKFNREAAEEAAKRYSIKPEKIFSAESNLESMLSSLFETARGVFLVDGYHVTVMFFMQNGKPVKIAQLDPDEHGEKYLLMREAANTVARTGADSVIMIGELWSAPFDSSSPYRRAADSSERREYLSAVMINKDGNPIRKLAEIIRKDGVSLGETQTNVGEALPIFTPIYEVWGKEIPADWKDSFFSKRDGVLKM